MIYFSHSYNLHKAFERAVEKGAKFDGIYFNKLHKQNGKNNSFIKKCVEKGYEVIYESPLYCSSYFQNSKQKIVIDRDLSNEILPPEKNIDYIFNVDEIVNDCAKCWKNYLKKIPDISGLKTVLSLPYWNGLNEKSWNKLIALIPDHKYSYISFTIDARDIDVNSITLMKEVIKKIMIEKDISKILFCVKSVFEISSLDQKKIILLEGMLEYFQAKNIIIHHSQWLIPQISSKYSIAFGLHNQTNTLFSTQLPFVSLNTPVNPRAKSILLAKFATKFHINHLINFYILEKNKNLNLWWIKKVENIFKDYLSETISIDDEIFLNWKEHKKIINMSNEEKENAIEKSNEFLNNLTKTQQRKIIYRIDGREYKKLLK